MTPRITVLPEKKIIGMRMTMCYADYKSREVWLRFMLRRKEILNAIGTDYYSMQLFSSGYYNHFDAKVPFEYWAALTVTDFEMLPEAMDSFTIPSGLYAVFTYKGVSSSAAAFFQAIFTRWLPNSIYDLDHRPHFEILGDKYKNDNPDLEEEVWIPIKAKKY
jgi:AraC family transcriptional regulator